MTIAHISKGVLISFSSEREDRERRQIANFFLSTLHINDVSRGGGISPKNLIKQSYDEHCIIPRVHIILCTLGNTNLISFALFSSLINDGGVIENKRGRTLANM